MPARRRSVAAPPRGSALALARAFALALVLGLASPGTAAASGFAAARFGGEHGNVVESNPTALYYNPAGIAFAGGGLHLYADGLLAIRRATWTHAPAPTDAPDPAGAEGANSGRATLLNLFGAPMLGVTYRREALAFGAAVYVPFGGRARWDRNPRFDGDAAFPLAADGVQRWHGIDGALTFLYVTGGAAYRAGRLSLGVTGNLIRSSVLTTRAQNPLGDGAPDTTREGRITVDVDGTQASFGVGAMLEAVPARLWLGASYQAQPGLGAMRLRGTLRTSYQSGAAAFPVTLDQALPDIIRVGARLRVGPLLEVRLHGDLTRWSVLGTQCVAVEGHACAVFPSGADATGDGSVIQNLRRGWRDTVGVRAGASVWALPALELVGGVGYETAAVPDATLDPALPDAASVSGALGARVALGATLFVAATYTHVQYFTRDNTGQSRLADAELPTRRADGGGRYTAWLGLLNLNIEKQF